MLISQFKIDVTTHILPLHISFYAYYMTKAVQKAYTGIPAPRCEIAGEPKMGNFLSTANAVAAQGFHAFVHM